VNTSVKVTSNADGMITGVDGTLLKVSNLPIRFTP